MINKSPTNLNKFPVPVTGQEIPKGWFARLVSYINSLVLHGDGQYLAVTHNMSGTTIKPTPALLQLASARGAAPSSGGDACIPNYAAGESVTIGQAYAITSPGWLIGYVRAVFPATSGDYYAVWTLGLSRNGSQIEQITLASQRFAGGSTLEITSFISILLPAGVRFSISQSTNAGAYHTLKAYPCL